jgi:hypothetical protein
MSKTWTTDSCVTSKGFNHINQVLLSTLLLRNHLYARAFRRGIRFCDFFNSTAYPNPDPITIEAFQSWI